MRASPIAAAAVLLPILAPTAPALAQPPTPEASRAACTAGATTPQDLLAEAQKTNESGDRRSAAACFEVAAGQAAGLKLVAEEAQARLGLGRALYGLADYARAEDAAERAIALFDQLGDRLNAARATRLEASIRQLRGDRAGARPLYEAAIRQFEAAGADKDRAQALHGLSMLLPHAEQLPALDLALELARKAADGRTEGRILLSRSDSRFTDGRFDEAVADLQAAIEVSTAVHDRTGVADAYVSLGRLHRAHGDLETALEAYDKAIALQQEGGDLRSLVQALDARANTLTDLGRTDEARREHERECEIARRTGSERIVTFAEGNLASAYAAGGENEKAVALLLGVIGREKNPYQLAYRHEALAGSYGALGRVGEALVHAEEGVAFARASENRDFLPTALWRWADVERLAGRHAEALVHAQEAVAAIEELRSRLVPLDYLKRGFAEVHQKVFGLTVALMLDRGRESDALVASEQARARAFLDLLSSRDLVKTAGKGAAGTDTVPARELALASYASASPANAQAIATIARRLASTILSYWTNADELFVWVVEPGGAVHAARVAVAREALEQAIAAADPSSEKPDRAALSRLENWLIGPVRSFLPPNGRALTVIPHGVLFRVPFAALRDPARGTYLVERYALSYAPSISSFTLTERLATRAAAHGALLVADPSPLPRSKKNPTLPPLTASRQEAADVQRILGASGTVLLAGAAAAEPAVRRALPGRRVVHLATHAVVRDDTPLDSFLALGAAGGDAASDGRLTVRDIYDLSLDANLVFLSACRTAGGKPSGDGIAGLSRALFYAGTPSVVATLWDVADEPSAILVSDFYAGWRRGLDKRAALRSAQRRMIAGLRAGTVVARTPPGPVRLSDKPFYWASYVLLGEPW